MRTETRVRVSPEMRALLDEEINWHRNQGVNISLVEATRIVAKRYKEKRHKYRSEYAKNKNEWEGSLGIR